MDEQQKQALDHYKDIYRRLRRAEMADNLYGIEDATADLHEAEDKAREVGLRGWHFVFAEDEVENGGIL